MRVHAFNQIIKMATELFCIAGVYRVGPALVPHRVKGFFKVDEPGVNFPLLESLTNLSCGVFIVNVSSAVLLSGINPICDGCNNFLLFVTFINRVFNIEQNSLPIQS